MIIINWIQDFYIEFYTVTYIEDIWINAYRYSPKYWFSKPKMGDKMMRVSFSDHTPLIFHFKIS